MNNCKGFVFLILANLILISCAGGGGGSREGNPVAIVDTGFKASSTRYSHTNAEEYRTGEYKYYVGLENIHAAEAYAYLAEHGKVNAGYGVSIAIIEGGMQTDHQDIAKNFDKDNSTGEYDNNTFGNHATSVASVAAGVKNGSGSHGVAYNSGIVSFAIKLLNSQIIDAINQASSVASIGVINGSFGGGASTYDGTYGRDDNEIALINALKVAKNSDILSIFSAGNGGHVAPNPSTPAVYANNKDLSGYVLAVGAIDYYDQNRITSYSNYCGAAKDYCLVADGYAGIAIASPNSTSEYAYAYGTSFSAPMVSGAAAVLRAAWPHLTAPQTANILLTTATDLGANGVDNVYGHGLLNLYAAVQAQGSNSFAYGNSVNNVSYDVRQTSFSSDPIFGDAFSANVAPALQNTVFFDDYGRDYKAFLGNKITQKNNYSIASNLSAMILNNYKTNSLPLSFSADKSGENLSQIKLRVRSYNNNALAQFLNFDKSLEDKALTNNNGFSFAQNIGTNNRFTFAFNVDELSNSFSEKFNGNLFLSTNSIAANPYQSFIGGVSQNLQFGQITPKKFNQLFFEHKLFSNKLRVNFSYQTSYESSSLLGKISDRDNQILNTSFIYNPNKNTNLIMSFGSLNEFNNNFLNSRASGAFEAGSNAKTSYAKFALSHDLFQNLTTIASFSEGLTEVQGNNLGIFRDYRDIRSRSFSVGLVANKFLGGKFGFLYNEPLRVYSGKAAINVPIARDNAGNVTHYIADVSLAPQGKQRNFEISYNHEITRDSQLSFNFVVSRDVANIKGNDARVALISYIEKF